MTPSTPGDDRRRELQADRALFGLSAAETRELAELDPGGDADALDELALAAGALDVALTSRQEEPLPAHLSEKILSASRSWSEPVTAPPSPASTITRAHVGGDAQFESRPRRRRELLGWLAAAAASIVALVLGRRQIPGAGESESPPTPAELRSRLLALRRETPDAVVQIPWTQGADQSGANAEGDVVWSDREQAGVMRFRGLAANDPAKNQYQLWIFDPGQDERYPVDGGVFDVPAGVDEVLVAIDAKLRVEHPTLFAITVEKPGGVVVSDRSRLPLLAQVER